MIRVGVIGYGYWGPNLVRNFSEAPGCEVAIVADLRDERLAQVRKRYPAVRTTTSVDDVYGADVDAVVIATPVSTHYELASRALRAGKHVWVEKPMTATADEARRLVDEAAAAGRLLHVDHTFVYTGAVRKIHELIHSDGVGEIYYYDSTRVNLGLFQHDVNVIWDLAVHDVSIMDYLLPTQARAVSATGIAHVDGALEDIAYLTFFFDGNLIGHVNVNWLAPVKIRRTLIGGSRRMIVYDDLEPSEKIKVYDKGITVTSDPARVYQMKIGYRSGDMWAPQVDIGEALQLEVRHFAECIAAGRPTDTDGRAGLRMVQALEAATESMRDRGRVIELEQV
ncbi:MAG: Gfo/Idh/MocA family oxidoreductase [Acidobacteriota bacterium]|nr:MAG: oxidoreductase [Acidobacteriota bacterium]